MMLWTRRRVAVAVTACLGLALVGSPGETQPEEIFSRLVRVHAPKGTFAQALIRVGPGSGADWRVHFSRLAATRFALPATVQPDFEAKGSLVLRATLSDDPTRPLPILRLDSYSPAEGEPTSIDLEYAEAYAEEYPEAAFGGKFTVTDSGMIVLPKGERLALVGGTYKQGAAGAYRLQVAYLTPTRQLFLTFDCKEEHWESRYRDIVAAVVLSLSLPGK